MPLPTIQHVFDRALQRHQAGQLAEAERLYRQILAQQPSHAEALHYLGVIAHQTGRNDIAANLIRRAISLRPDYADAYNNLAAALKDAGRVDEAIAACRQAIALRPGFAKAHNNLGNALRERGQVDEAIATCRQAIALEPGFAEAYNNLGNALGDKGLVDGAIAAYRQCIALRPGYAEAHLNLAGALKDKGKLDEAIAECHRAIALGPDVADAHANLGALLHSVGEFDQAIAACKAAIALSPRHAGAYSNLGMAFRDKDQLDEAIAAYRQALGLDPGCAEAANNLGVALRSKGQLDEAIAAYQQAIALRPDYADAYTNLGAALADSSGRLDEAIAAARHAMALRPGSAVAHSNLIFALHLHPDYDAGRIAEELRHWNRQHAEPLQSSGPTDSSSAGGAAKPWAILVTDRSPERRLRIGYVSPDLRDHVVGRNMLPLFKHHDRQRFEIFCYANSSIRDTMTQELGRYADGWRIILGTSDDQAAAEIRDDRIDILVDLALHTAHNRLLIFARKPAPVQVTFAGYPGSTGLTAIDYRLSDPYLDPPGMDESIYSEQTIRLPRSFWCFDPLDCREIPIHPLPALENRYVTFGCLNNFCKINETILAVWAQALRQVENSRLLLLAPPGSHRQRTMDQLARAGVDPRRVAFVPKLPRREYLALYHQIDVGLDSFPYNGHTTSLESFWMGVPVVTLVGQTPVSRAGWCQLSNLGLTELAGHTKEEFIEIAVKLAGDLSRLKELRSTLRQRMERSPLMDAQQFARSIEAAYRDMWQSWCETARKGN